MEALVFIVAAFVVMALIAAVLTRRANQRTAQTWGLEHREALRRQQEAVLQRRQAKREARRGRSKRNGDGGFTWFDGGGGGDSGCGGGGGCGGG